MSHHLKSQFSRKIAHFTLTHFLLFFWAFFWAFSWAWIVPQTLHANVTQNQNEQGKESLPSDGAITIPEPNAAVNGHPKDHPTTDTHGSASQTPKKGANMFILSPPQPNLALSKYPEKPQLKSPSYMEKISGNSITLRWEPVKGATHYYFQLATDPQFKWIVSEVPLSTTTEYTPQGLNPSSSYYWRVASVNVNNVPGKTKSFFSTSMFYTP